MHVNFALSEFGAADQSHVTSICPLFGSYWISHGAEDQRAVSSRFPSTDERRVGGVTLLERSRSATYRSKSHNTLTTPSTRPACCLLRMAMGRSCRKCGRLQIASKQNGDHRINRMITGESGICAENLEMLITPYARGKTRALSMLASDRVVHEQEEQAYRVHPRAMKICTTSGTRIANQVTSLC